MRVPFLKLGKNVLRELIKDKRDREKPNNSRADVRISILAKGFEKITGIQPPKSLMKRAARLKIYDKPGTLNELGKKLNELINLFTMNNKPIFDRIWYHFEDSLRFNSLQGMKEAEKGNEIYKIRSFFFDMDLEGNCISLRTDIRKYIQRAIAQDRLGMAK